MKLIFMTLAMLAFLSNNTMASEEVTFDEDISMSSKVRVMVSTCCGCSGELFDRWVPPLLQTAGSVSGWYLSSDLVNWTSDDYCIYDQVPVSAIEEYSSNTCAHCRATGRPPSLEEQKEVFGAYATHPEPAVWIKSGGALIGATMGRATGNGVVRLRRKIAPYVYEPASKIGNKILETVERHLKDD